MATDPRGIKIGKEHKTELIKPFSLQPTNIIIPFHGQYEKVTRLVESILQCTLSNPYQIVLVDDASPNHEFIDSFKEVVPDMRGFLPQIITFRSKERLGFGGALELGFMASEQPWVCFMHSDCEIRQNNWLQEMGETLVALKNTAKVKMVGPKTDKAENQFQRGSSHESHKDIVLEDGMGDLDLFCVLCHRQLFNRIGGFVKKYPLKMYEDAELAYRMRHYGYKQAVSGKSHVVHHGGSTVSEICKNDPSAATIMESNRDRCLKDMQTLAATHRGAGTRIFRSPV